MKFYITRHCKERYVERALDSVFSHDNIIKHILNKVYEAKNITSKVSEEYPRFILYLKERYGKDQGYNILKNKNMIFIAIKKKGTKNLYNVVTCYNFKDTFEKFKNTALNKNEIYDKLSLL